MNSGSIVCVTTTESACIPGASSSSMFSYKAVGLYDLTKSYADGKVREITGTW